MYSDNSFFSSTFAFVTSSTGSSSSAALVHGSNTSTSSTTSGGGGGSGGQFNSAYAVGGGGSQPQPQIHYLQLPSSISQQQQQQQRETRTMSSRSAHHGHRARSRPYNIVKPIQKRVERTRRDSISASMTPTRSSTARTGGGARTPNLFIDQQQERPSGSTPLSSSGQIHTPLAIFEASFDGIAALGFDLDAFGSNERLMATSPTLSASS